MGHRHRLTIHRIAIFAARGNRCGCDMRDDLVAVEVEIDPVAVRSALRTSQQRAIEIARHIEIVDREGEMKGGDAHARSCAALGRAKATAWASA